MIILFAGVSLLAGMGLGWYGHKAKLRIDAWGEKANERDLIFQVADNGKSFEGEWKRRAGSDGSLPPLAASHMTR